MTETAERHWGIMVLAKEFSAAMLECYLPDGHRVLASKVEPCASFDQHIIVGPDMPVVADGKYPDRVDMLYYTDESGIEYAYWSHQPEKRWLISLQFFTA